jgi:short-subunit dehydrogenase
LYLKGKIVKSQKKTVLVTGATAGIGKQVTLDLLRRGHTVIATGRRADAVSDLVAEARAGSLAGTCHGVSLDVTCPDTIAAAVIEVARLTGGAGVDVLINNAGYATAGPMMELGDDVLAAQFDTNVFGLMRVTRAFGEAMIERRRGRIINVGSVSGRIPAPMLGAYHATKYALEAITDALRMELRPFGIDVIIVEPGTIRTGFADRVIREADAARASSTRYGDVYQRQSELAAKFDRVAAHPETVARALVRAVEAKRPRIRIVAPGRFLLAIIAVRLLPVCWVDALMRRIAGLDRLARLPAAR